MARKPSKPLVLVLDYDETVTSRDTLALLARWARADSLAIPPEAVSNHPDLSGWHAVVDAYLADLAGCKARQQQQQHFGTHVTLDDYIGATREVDQRSILRVSASRVLAGINRSLIRSKVECLAASTRDRSGADGDSDGDGRHSFVQPGFSSFVQAFDRHFPESIYVLSLNWSKDLIQATLSQCGISVASDRILSNDLEFTSPLEGPASQISTGTIVGDIHNGVDKARKLKELIAAKGLGTTVVYIGDSAFLGLSSSDLPCAIAADIGILIRRSSALDVCERFSIPVADLPRDIGACKQSVLYVAPDGWRSVGQTMHFTTL
ncbi:uncharacterized protein BJ171DRAFT_582377 [Polychytrium aggregatum]|uniref:uncharacterized protein n=1 Tax=Polychytrium aggregatum TaxID=110093 RepID=UPI0022FDE32A|nr:uncharacterized protein BJ171DRAFT_582377 [Polychytrium aggregatum]KAI9204000.1 hypothetical protein BJ171DRAFT_582377 [Polychytrium aggregatum]